MAEWLMAVPRPTATLLVLGTFACAAGRSWVVLMLPADTGKAPLVCRPGPGRLVSPARDRATGLGDDGRKRADAKVSPLSWAVGRGLPGGTRSLGDRAALEVRACYELGRLEGWKSKFSPANPTRRT